MIKATMMTPSRENFLPDCCDKANFLLCYGSRYELSSDLCMIMIPDTKNTYLVFDWKEGFKFIFENL